MVHNRQVAHSRQAWRHIERRSLCTSRSVITVPERLRPVRLVFSARGVHLCTGTTGHGAAGRERNPHVILTTGRNLPGFPLPRAARYGDAPAGSRDRGGPAGLAVTWR